MDTGRAGAGHYDAIVVGGGTAGLSAALVLGRSRRRVLVLDGGEPRNAPSAASHGFFTRDGVGPEELLKIGREQLEAYPGVELRPRTAAGARGSDGAFEVALEGGGTAAARKLVLASGVVDDLPSKPGFRELWGRGVYHCPYCHGWEVRDRPLAVLASGEGTLRTAVLIRNWSRDLVVLTDGPSGLDEDGRARLRALGVPVEERRISRFRGEPATADGYDHAAGPVRVVFEDDSELSREGVFHVPPQRQRSDLAASLGCELERVAHATAVKTDPASGETTVPGVYAAGDATGPVQAVVLAAASGARAAFSANHALAAEDADAELGALDAGQDRARRGA